LGLRIPLAPAGNERHGVFIGRTNNVIEFRARRVDLFDPDLPVMVTTAFVAIDDNVVTELDLSRSVEVSLGKASVVEVSRELCIAVGSES